MISLTSLEWQIVFQRLPLPHLMTKLNDGKHAKKTAECPQHAVNSLQDVTSETFLHHYWGNLSSGLQRGKVKRHFFAIRYVERLDNATLKEVTKSNAKSEKACYISPKFV